MPNQPADIFKLKPSERDCKTCGDGKLYVEPISEFIAKHYCDNCDWFEIYKLDPEPMNVIPSNPLPEDTMPDSYPHGFSKTEYSRWLNCGKPDIDDYKKSGCPTPKKWQQLQASGDESSPPATFAPAPATKPKRQKRKAAAKPTQLPAKHEPETVSQALTPAHDASPVKVKVLSIEFEGNAGQVLDQLHQLLGNLRR